MNTTGSLTTYQMLDRFRHKAGAWQSQGVARALLAGLKVVLTEEEYSRLSVAHTHYETGEGTAELYEVCSELLKKYKPEDL